MSFGLKLGNIKKDLKANLSFPETIKRKKISNDKINS